MKKDVLKGLGNIAEGILGGLAGKSPATNRKAQDPVGNVVDSILDHITGVLGGGTQRTGRSGAGRGGFGQARGGRGGAGGMRCK
jgi:hypothetical protein